LQAAVIPIPQVMQAHSAAQAARQAQALRRRPYRAAVAMAALQAHRALALVGKLCLNTR